MQIEAKAVGRNDTCPCGSGKKYKRCCALLESRTAKFTPAPSRQTSTDELLVLFQARRYAEVEVKARGLIERRLDSGLVWKLLGAALWLQQKDALGALEKAAQLLPDDAEAHTNLGNVQRATGRLAQAEATHRRAIAIRADYAEAHNNLGSVLKDLNRAEEAVECYRRALSLKPDFALAHANLAVVLAALDRRDEARACLKRALIMKPDFAEAHAHLGELHLHAGEREQARLCFERALAIHPRFAQVHAHLGLLEREAGQLEQAAVSLRRALECNPNDLDTRNNLGIILRELGLMQEAADCFRGALTLAPDHPDIHNHLGSALFDLGSIGEAVSSYQRAISLRPDFAKAYSNLGGAYRELGSLDEAEEAFLKALELAPNLAEARANLGTVQRLQGKSALAEASGRKALESNPCAPTTLVFLAEVHADRGDFAEAQRLLKQVIELDPDSPQACAGIAAVRKMTTEDADWIAHAQRIASRRLRPRDEVQLHYAMGKYYDDIREFDRAFDHYRRANELTKTYRPPHDRRHLEHSFATARSLYDGEWIEQMREIASHDSRPVFVIGTPRSGTSLAEQILASHVDVFGAGEQSFWKTASIGIGEARMREASEGALGNAAQAYLRRLDELAPSARRVVDKMPANFLYVGMIHAALPQARFIHMRRNPLDSCLSIYFQNFHLTHTYANDLDDLAHFYRQYLGIMEYWRGLLPPGVLLDIDYEALVADPESNSRRMLEHIGLPWDAACLDFHNTARSVTTFSKWQVRQPVNSGSVARWRRYEKHVTPLLSVAPPA